MTKTLSALNTTRNCLPELAGHFLSIFSLSMEKTNWHKLARLLIYPVSKVKCPGQGHKLTSTQGHLYYDYITAFIKVTFININIGQLVMNHSQGNLDPR